MFILALALMVMCSIYIGQLVWPAAAPLIVCMHICLWGVAIIYYYLHPEILQALLTSINKLNLNKKAMMCTVGS